MGTHLVEETLKNRNLNYESPRRYSDGDQAIRALYRDECIVPDLILLDLKPSSKIVGEHSATLQRKIRVGVDSCSSDEEISTRLAIH